MLFSIVIPIHNGERYLSDCMESALMQDSGLAEIILVENGSTDRTPELVDEYARKYDNVIALHRGRIGLFAARQEGIKASSGDWIIALDADDKLKENAIGRLFGFLTAASSDNPDIDLVIYKASVMTVAGETHSLNSEDSFDNRIYEGADKEELYEQFCRDDSLNSMWTKCIRRDIAEVTPSDIFLNYGEDLYQTATYLERADKIAVLNQDLYFYRKNEDSLTASYSNVFLDNQKIVWARMDDFLVKRNNDKYTEWVRARKSLTCSILITTIIYSKLSYFEKRAALKKAMDDDFYKTYAYLDLPEWAPEEDVFVHGLQMSSRPMKALLSNAVKHDLKVAVKKCLKR